MSRPILPGSQHNVAETEGLIPPPKIVIPLYEAANPHLFSLAEDATLIYWKDPIRGVGGEWINCAFAIGNGRTQEQCKERYEALHPEHPDYADGFTVEENNQLIKAIDEKSGSWAWIKDQLPYASYGRKMEQIKRQAKVLDWKRDNQWAPAEVEKLRSLKEDTALKWDEIAAELPGRSENDCRERWALLHPYYGYRAEFIVD